MLNTYPPVNTKVDFVQRYKAGEFGNASPTWDTFTDWASSSWKDAPDQLFHLRNRVRGGPTWYDVKSEDVASTWERICSTGQVRASDLYISAMAPTPRTLFQGEVVQSPIGLQMIHSTVAKPMREALREETIQTQGLISWSWLRLYLDPNSLDWLQILLDRYPEHVVEFSTYSVCWGTLPGLNTVIWEVRLY